MVQKPKQEFVRLTPKLIDRLAKEKRCFDPQHISKFEELSKSAAETRSQLEQAMKDFAKLQEAVSAKEVEIKTLNERLNLMKDGSRQEAAVIRSEAEKEINELQSIIDEQKSKLEKAPQQAAAKYQREGACFNISHVELRGLKSGVFGLTELMVFTTELISQYNQMMIAPRVHLVVFVDEPFKGLVDAATHITETMRSTLQGLLSSRRTREDILDMLNRSLTKTQSVDPKEPPKAEEPKTT